MNESHANKGVSKARTHRYVDAFCGRVPSSVLARSYSDFSVDKLWTIYEEACLCVLDWQSLCDVHLFCIA